jgi:hypothetical protein
MKQTSSVLETQINGNNSCAVCHSEEGEQKSWIGCDYDSEEHSHDVYKCGRWYHKNCIENKHLPTKNKKWLCPSCKLCYNCKLGFHQNKQYASCVPCKLQFHTSCIFAPFKCPKCKKKTIE